MEKYYHLSLHEFDKSDEEISPPDFVRPDNTDEEVPSSNQSDADIPIVKAETIDTVAKPKRNLQLYFSGIIVARCADMGIRFIYNSMIICNRKPQVITMGSQTVWEAVAIHELCRRNLLQITPIPHLLTGRRIISGMDIKSIFVEPVDEETVKSFLKECME